MRPATILDLDLAEIVQMVTGMETLGWKTKTTPHITFIHPQRKQKPRLMICTDGLISMVGQPTRRPAVHRAKK